MKIFAIDLLEQIENEIKQIDERINSNSLETAEEYYYMGIKRGLKAAHYMIFIKMYEEDGARNYKINSKVYKA